VTGPADPLTDVLEIAAGLAGAPLPEQITAAIGYALDRAVGRSAAALLAGDDRLSADPALTQHLGLTPTQARALATLLFGCRRTPHRGRPPTPARPGLIALLARRTPLTDADRTLLTPPLHRLLDQGATPTRRVPGTHATRCTRTRSSSASRPGDPTS
jgi:hypothetical protein